MTRPRQISDEQVLAAAREVFLEQGASAPTSLVAERAGISQAVLFQRFGTKEKLLLLALAPPRDMEWLAGAAKGPDGRDLRVQLCELAEGIMSHFERIMPAMLVLKSAGIGPDELFAGHDIPPPLQGHHLMRDWFAVARERGRIGEVDPEALAMSFVGAIQSWVFLRHIAGERFQSDRCAYIEALVDLLWRGLAPEGPR